MILSILQKWPSKFLTNFLHGQMPFGKIKSNIMLKFPQTYWAKIWRFSIMFLHAHWPFHQALIINTMFYGKHMTNLVGHDPASSVKKHVRIWPFGFRLWDNIGFWFNLILRFSFDDDFFETWFTFVIVACTASVHDALFRLIFPALIAQILIMRSQELLQPTSPRTIMNLHFNILIFLFFFFIFHLLIFINFIGKVFHKSFIFHLTILHIHSTIITIWIKKVFIISRERKNANPTLQTRQPKNIVPLRPRINILH